jgi:GNAT superfamily N-acetyltransferase
VNIRRFAKGVDEPVWVDMLNASRRDRDEWRAMTAQEMLRQEEGDPGFDLEGRFIAELAGRPVGVVHANVDRFREESRGFVRLDVRPELRSQGIEQQLLEIALTELKARGMTIAQAGAYSDEEDYLELLKESGFSHVRVGSTMEMDLANVSHDIGENTQVTIRSLQGDREEDIKLYNWLGNETFKEHFNYRPDTVEEIRHFLFSDLYYDDKEVFFAVLDGKGVGYVGVGVDDRYNMEKNTKSGDIFSIGVLKGHRRTGIGARLMLHGLENLKAKGMTKALLGAWTTTIRRRQSSSTRRWASGSKRSASPSRNSCNTLQRLLRCSLSLPRPAPPEVFRRVTVGPLEPARPQVAEEQFLCLDLRHLADLFHPWHEEQRHGEPCHTGDKEDGEIMAPDEGRQERRDDASEQRPEAGTNKYE